MTMQASQPGQTETAANETTATEPSIDESATAATTANCSDVTTETITTDELAPDAPATNDAPVVQAASVTQKDSPSAIESMQAPKKETPVTSAGAATDGTTVESKLEENKNENDEVRETLGGEPVSPFAKPEPIPQRPKTWAHLLKKESVKTTLAANATAAATANGNGEQQPSGALGTSHSSTRALGDVLRTYDPSKGKAIFIEPRGLYNARVDCYMISVSRTWSRSAVKRMLTPGFVDSAGLTLLRTILPLLAPSQDAVRSELEI